MRTQLMRIITRKARDHGQVCLGYAIYFSRDTLQYVVNAHIWMFATISSLCRSQYSRIWLCESSILVDAPILLHNLRIRLKQDQTPSSFSYKR